MKEKPGNDYYENHPFGWNDREGNSEGEMERKGYVPDTEGQQGPPANPTPRDSAVDKKENG